MRLRFWPRSLATRTALVLLGGLALVQAGGLTIHALDRMDLQRLTQAREFAAPMLGLYRVMLVTPAPAREAVLAEQTLPARMHAVLAPAPPDLDHLMPPAQRLLRASMTLVPVPGPQRPREMQLFGSPGWGHVEVAMHLPDGPWLVVSQDMPPARPWHSTNFLAAFLGMTLLAGLLSLWAVRRLTEPVRTLAAAAERLGRDVGAPPLPEDGPSEVATAAAAFNTMAARIRRYVQDRTFMLTAIGHDLRTPITRLKLRCEFLDDEEQRRKMLQDLDELERMISATLAFGRDDAATERVSALDLAVLLRTVLDEAGDARPDLAERLDYAGPPHLTVRARPVALKRALVNLVGNAVAYGSSARIRLHLPEAGTVRIEVEDDGPGIPEDQLDRVFQPFHRVEASRNRETGGVGLGLPIARNILLAHGGDVTLGNRETGGACARVTLPV